MNLSREKSRYKDHAAKVHDAAWQCHFHYFHTHSFSTLFGRRGWLLFPCSISSIPGDDVNPIRKGSCHKTSAESNMRSYLLWRPDVNEQAAKSCLKHVRLLCRQNCRFNQDISGSHFVTFLSIVKALILHKWLSDFLSICEDTPSKISQTYTSSNVKTITWIVQLRISNLDNECTPSQVSWFRNVYIEGVIPKWAFFAVLINSIVHCPPHVLSHNSMVWLIVLCTTI